jgi:aminomethyltransferase
MLQGHSLLALQGPASEAALASLAPGVTELGFMQAGEFELGDARCLVHRCGYTGEDGFEISVADEQAQSLARRLLACPGVEPAGLGARDSLRLEAGLCLYGHDLDPATTPVEAGLSWIIARRYRSDENAKARFPGAHIILEQLKSGPPRKRVGLLPRGRVPVRAGAGLTDIRGLEAGRVTSGGFGCTLDRPVAMGYVAPQFAEPGTELQVRIRNRSEHVQVAALPFITLHYRH